MAEPIISVSGLRGVVGDTLTPDVAVRYVAAFASTAPAGPIVVTRDGRATGAMLADAVSAALLASGRDAIMADVAATPTTGVLVRSLGAAGGVQISASHNPAEYNGLKLFSAAGRVIPAGEGAKVLEAYRAGHAAWTTHSAVGTSKSCDDTTSEHVRLVSDTVDSRAIRAANFKVVLDANHGAGSLVGRRLLDELGCEVHVLGEPPDGKFAHPPEPTRENLKSVLDRIVEVGADIGFCQDPDADRLAIVDAGGRYLGEEYTLALCVDHVLRSRRGPVVTNCSTSRMAEDIAAKHGVPFFRSAVGEANVVDCMLAHDAVLGGEGNGGVIDPRVVLVRDSFVAMALVLDAMQSCGLPVAALADELPRYEIVKTKVELPREKIQPALAALAARFPEAQVDRLDGLRLDWPGRWLLVRGSNTEPIIRAIAECPTAEEAQRLCDSANEALLEA